MNRRFVIEAVMIAIYGQMLSPSRPVEYLIPYSSILELYEMKESVEPVMPEPDDDVHVKQKIGELIAFFEEPLNKKKIERSLLAPWRKSPPLLVKDGVSITVVNASENAQYGELFDPIETEIILTSLREQTPVLTDQVEFTDRVIEAEIPIQVFDVDDFEFALEADLTTEDWMTTP
ncbi:ADP-heptose synthase [Paenibacillus thermoaerophilus]|uniref:ADP-heptose synthase n=1 Tax=Paenibacillus thermoaerophilus TaxID=1215385 RepID=A0ABW2V2L6_9BACL|nr:ADP-heptose synthase [Paenibacillus thermoaerophilus]TMV10459.1 ADP-heptose synthase [Paenibacillus thermoaerophilus]